MVIDNGVPDLWFNATLILSSVALLVTSPVLGLTSDRAVPRLRYLWYCSAIMFVCGLAIPLVGFNIQDHTTRVTLALVLFFAIMYAYQLSLVFYNAMLSGISQPGAYSRVSGSGLAWGWVGGIIAVLFILPFVQGFVPPFQPASRLHAILPSTVLFGILALVSLYLLRGTPDHPSGTALSSLSSLFREVWHDFREMARGTALWKFLLAYFFFSDAILTIQNNCTIYMDAVFRMSDNAKAAQFISVLLFSSLGAVISGRIRGVSPIRTTLLVSLVGWVGAIAIAASTSSPLVFSVSFAVMGFLNGVVWNNSRVLFLLLAPPAKRGQYFGLYSSFERLATFFGPLMWSAPLTLLPSASPIAYRLALVSMAVLILPSIFLLRTVVINENRSHAS